MKIYQCDECGEQRRAVITIYPNGGQADFCSMECLKSWATDVAVQGYLDDHYREFTSRFDQGVTR